jgi:NADPH:quinone reductase-like Zn-dependent oxidoreductase
MLGHMQAVMVHETGGPEVLRLEEVDDPQPGDGLQVVRVRAASVNPIDWKFRRGLAPKPLPAILGNDFSGVVEGSGEEVFGVAAAGAYAELAVAAVAAAKPAGLSHEQAAALPVAGMTSWQALFDRGGLQSGQTALVAGAAGGVGHLAVQFAKHAGAHVIATGSARNRDFVMGLGADEYVDYTQQDVGEVVSGADVIFDAVGGQTTASLVGAAAEGGVFVTIAGPPPEVPGVRGEMLVMSPDAQQLARIGELVAGGEVRVEIAEVIPFAEIARAHELSESGHVRGKIVLRW